MVEWKSIKRLLEHRISPPTSICQNTRNNETTSTTCVGHLAANWDNLDKKLQSIPRFLAKSSDNQNKGKFFGTGIH